MALYLTNNTETVAFLYRWTQKSTGKWYEGSRTASKCHPDDGYICSSRLVKPMILENKDDWYREILVIGDPKYIRELETKRLKSLDAKNDPMSFNRNNADGDFLGTVGDRKGEKNSFYGKHHTESTKRHFRELYLGTKRPDSIKQKISDTLIGVARPNKVKEKISIGVAKLQKLKCEHCGKLCPPATNGRWHGKNCRLRNDNVA